MTALLPFILIAGAFYALFQKRKSTAKLSIISFNSRKHFALLIGYVVFLLVVLVTAEIVERKHQPLSPVVDTSELNYESVIGESMDSPRFMEKRTHPAGDTLAIQNEYNGALLYVERKSNHKGIIEELIFKPMLVVNQYDFHDKVNVAKPIWQDGLLVIPQQPITEVRYAQFYHTLLLNQMTGSRHSSNSSFATGQLIIHLIVPEDVEIKVSSKSFIQYIEE